MHVPHLLDRQKNFSKYWEFLFHEEASNSCYTIKISFVFFYIVCVALLRIVLKFKFCQVLLRFNEFRYLFTEVVTSGWECNFVNIILDRFDIYSYCHGDDSSLRYKPET